MTYRDMTFCASPNCTCGRRLSKEELAKIPEWMPVAYSYFCDQPSEDKTLNENLDLQHENHKENK